MKIHEPAIDGSRIPRLPNANDGKPMHASQAAGGGCIPEDAKNVAAAKDFMTFFIQPQVMNENLKQGLGRWVPSIAAATIPLADR